MANKTHNILSQEEKDRLYALRLAQDEYFHTGSSSSRGGTRVIDERSIGTVVRDRGPFSHRSPSSSSNKQYPNIRITTIADEMRGVEMREQIANTLKNNRPIAFGENSTESDWNAARTIQAMEFEMAGDFRHYDSKEHDAADCTKQMLTISTLICVAQIIVFTVMTIEGGGIVSHDENPMYNRELCIAM
jgi:hypothetical protein